MTDHRPLLLDLFGGAGGAAWGYWQAGFDVLSVDLNPDALAEHPANSMPVEGFHTMQTDALGPTVQALIFSGRQVAAIHASPPCHAFSTVTGRNRKNDAQYPDLVEETRDLLARSGLPYIIENVPGAPLVDPIQLCGSAFGLDVRRHRIFESNVALSAPPCDHKWQTPRYRSLDSRMVARGSKASVVGVHGHTNYTNELILRQQAMGITWMSNATLSQAIPPAFTLYLGRQLLKESTT